MVNNKLWVFFSMGGLFLVSSCSDCEDLEERKFRLRFYHGFQEVKPAFEQVHGLGGNGLLQPQPADTLFHLPMSLHADSSTFVLLENTSTPDTLTITYKRDFFYEGEGCGFRVRYSNFGIGKSTTYDSAEVITTDTYLGWGGNFTEEIYEVRIYR